LFATGLATINKKILRIGVMYCIFIYLVASTIILLITQIKGLMNVMGWGIVVLHLFFMLWFGYFLIKPEEKDMI
jgi:predicted transporter